MPSSEFIGIIPAAGGGTRLGLPYPKELHSVEPGVLYVDYSLMQLREAGIKEAFVVTTSAKLGDLAKALMYERHGVKLHYVEVQPTDSKSLVGSVLRGCRRAEYRLEYEKFVVVLPDSKFGDHQAVKKLVEHGHEPSFLAFDCPDPSQFDSIYVQYDEVKRVLVKKPVDESLGVRAGCWGALTLDQDAVKRLKKLVRTTPAHEAGDPHLLGELIDADIASGGKWSWVHVFGGYVDLGEWDRVQKYVRDLNG